MPGVDAAGWLVTLHAVDDLARARALCDELGEIFCLTFVKGTEPRQALLRMGGDPETMREAKAGELEPPYAVALPLGAWSVVIEPGGSLGADHPLLEAVSRGTAAVSVLRHDHASAHFGYAVDGTTVAAFDPGYPSEETKWGSDPGMLRHLMDALGLRPPADDADESWQDAEPKALLLAQRITGAGLPDEALSASGISARLEPWFVTPARPGDLLRAGRRHPEAAGLVAAAEAAAPEVQRAVAVAEVRRQATALGLANTPGLAEALDAAARDAATPVAVDSPLGRQVRTWLAAADGSGLRWFVAALRGVLDPDPRVAVLAALRAHTSGLATLTDEESRAAALESLGG